MHYLKYEQTILVIGQFEIMKILSVNPVFCEDKSRITELDIFGSTQQCFDLLGL